MAALAAVVGGRLAAESIVVEAASGRVFSGQIDPRTSRQQLVVRTGGGDMYIARPIAWSHVLRVRVDGQPLEADELLARFDANGWPQALPEPPAPSPMPSDATPLPPVPRPPAPADAFGPEAFSDSPQAYQQWSAARSMMIDASVGRWSGFVDNDGVVVRVYPLDADGNIVPVSGLLEVDLIGSQTASLTRGEPFPRLARWVRRVDPQDVGADGAIYRLPFQARHPEFDLQLGSTGAVHARLSVPGQGAFDDTASMVWLRPYSYTRDRLQMHTGGRFFRGLERTSRGMNDSRSGVMAGP